MGEFSDMTRLEQLQTKAMMVLVGIQFAAIPLYLLKAVFLDPGKAIFGAVMLGLIAGMSAFVWKTAPRQASRIHALEFLTRAHVRRKSDVLI